MTAFLYRFLRLLPAALLVAGCSQSVRSPKPKTGEVEAKTPGVTANSGGDTRGTILYEPRLVPVPPADPYAVVSGKFVLPLRQKMAWELAEIDEHAHQQAANAFPVPDSASSGYTKKKAAAAAEHQADFNAYLLEKYHARFCSQFGVTYGQLALIIQEGREKNWPMPPTAKE